MKQIEPDTDLTDASGSAIAKSPRKSSTAKPVAAPAVAADDPRIVSALDDYSAAVHAGQTPDRLEFQSRYPEVAEALAECLEGLEFVRAAAPQLKHRAAEQPGGSGPWAEFWPADALGDYRIVRELGRGGMGVVYEVVQVSLGRRVALKVLPFAAALDAKQLQRFKNEAQAAAQLHHQNIVPVYGVGCERGVHYYAMQFIDGQTLAALIGELRPAAGANRREPPVLSVGTVTLAGELVSGRWAPRPRSKNELEATGPFQSPPASTATRNTPKGTGSSTAANTQPVAAASTERSTKSSVFFRTVANLGMQAAAALEHAHGQGVVHRDVKPANLLIDSRGNLWITDFGLAHIQNQAELTMTGDLMGTLRYMSPEQTLAQRVLLDHRTDIYSLGATLYELLTLQPVFDGRDRQALMRQITLEEPRPPRSINAAIPAELETIVLKALEKNPAERYATAQELADDLQRYLKDEPIRAKPPTLMHQMRKWTRRHIGVVRTALAMSAALLVAVAAVSSLAAWRLNDERTVTRNQLRLTQQAEAKATLRLYRSLVEQARANRLARRMGQRFKTLEILKEAAKTARELPLDEKDTLELRNEAIACLALPDVRVAKEWKGWPTGSMTLDFNEALERYARVDRQGMVNVHRVPDGALLWQVDAFGPGDYGGGKESWPRFSPDGSWLLVQRGERLKVWKLAARGPVVFREFEGVAKTTFSRDSRQLAIGHADGSIEFYDLATGAIAKHLATDLPAYMMAFDPSDQRLAVACAAGIRVYDRSTGDLVTSMPGAAGTYHFAWHPDGESLAGAIGRTVQTWDAVTGNPLVRMEGHLGDGMTLDFDHTGNLLATACWDGILRVWDPQAGQLLFRTHTSTPHLRFARDDRLLAASVTGEMLQLLDVRLPVGYRTLVRDPHLGRGEHQAGAISPKLPLLAVSMRDGVGFWHLTTGAPLAFLRSAKLPYILFAPSGDLLVNGETGIVRWPIEEDPSSAGSFTIGPPRQLAFNALASPMAQSADGAVLALGHREGALVWRPEDPGPPLDLTPHYDARFVDVSPDGRWVATGTHFATKVKIWSSAGKTPPVELPVEAGSLVAFSPNGKWLVTTGDSCRVWNVERWQSEPIRMRAAGSLAFSPDSSLLAIYTGEGTIRLMNPATGREYARLDDPDQDIPFWLGFSADGGQLVAVSSASKSIHVWDLRALRAELAGMNLDWGLPAYPPQSADDMQPMRLDVDLGPNK